VGVTVGADGNLPVPGCLCGVVDTDGTLRHDSLPPTIAMAVGGQIAICTYSLIQKSGGLTVNPFNGG
jgi:hypothetical protein